MYCIKLSHFNFCFQCSNIYTLSLKDEDNPSRRVRQVDDIVTERKSRPTNATKDKPGPIGDKPSPVKEKPRPIEDNLGPTQVGSEKGSEKALPDVRSKTAAYHTTANPMPMTRLYSMETVTWFLSVIFQHLDS